MKKQVLFIITLIIFLLISGYTRADRRYFGRSYLAYTLPMGTLEFELWNTGRIGKFEGFYYRFQPRFEFEYGVTDQLSASFYFNFDQTTSEENNFSSHPFSFSSTSLELKYRLTNPDEYFVDPALYFELSYGGDELEYEGKLIFSKRMDNWVAALNVTSEIDREITKTEHESAFEITGGLAYELSPGVALGIEFRHHRIFEDIYGEEEAQATYFGPAVNIQGNSFYLTLNVLKQITGSPDSKDNLDLIHHENYEFRTILGINL